MVNVSSYAILSGTELNINLLKNSFKDYSIGKDVVETRNFLVYAQNKAVGKNLPLYDFLQALSDKADSLKKMGVVEIDIYVNLEYLDQCNWELNREELSILNRIEATLSITAYRSEETHT